jgi:hypothetical protein
VGSAPDRGAQFMRLSNSFLMPLEQRRIPEHRKYTGHDRS